MRRSFLAVATAALAMTVACASETRPGAMESPNTETQSPDTASITTGSCIEQYSLDTLKGRDYAFDGVVAEIKQGAGDTAEDVVVFDVSRWYKGGSERRATRRAHGFAAVTSAGGSPHVVGERLLVAGDEDFAWECGFTQPYDESVAADWESAFGS